MAESALALINSLPLAEGDVVSGDAAFAHGEVVKAIRAKGADYFLFVKVQPAQASDWLQPQALKALFPGTFQAVVHGQDITFVARRDGSLVGRSHA